MNSVFDQLNKPIKSKKDIDLWLDDTVMNYFWNAFLRDTSDLIYEELGNTYDL